MATDGGTRDADILVESERLSVTYGSRPGGKRVTGSHVHEHTEAFYVLAGELTFEVDAKRETVTLGAGGFAAFMRGLGDGVQIEWDIAPAPPDGLSADHVMVSTNRLPGRVVD